MKNWNSLIRGCVVAVLVLPLVGAAGNASAQNLLVNPDFETGDLTGWQVFGQSALSDVMVQAGDNGPTLPGTHNAYMENQAQAIGLTLKQTTGTFTATGGTVSYSYDLKLDQADAGGVLFVEIFAEAEGVGIVGGSGLIGPLFPWEWTSYSGTFVAPETTTFLTIQFMANTGANVGSNCLVHVDNVNLELQGVVPNDATSWSGIKADYR